MNTFTSKDIKPTMRKVNHFQTEKQILFQYLQKNIATAAMVEEATGIRICNITRHKRSFEKNGTLEKLFRSICRRTGYRAWYLTTDPLIISSLKKRRHG